jgi:hypothetical protein
MHQQAAGADGIAEAGDPGDHIGQQGRTEPLASSRTTLDYAEILARLPKPPRRPRKALLLHRG